MVSSLATLSSAQAPLVAFFLFALFAFIPFEASIAAYIVVGQAHLFLTFFHHARTKKVHGLYIAVACLCAVGAIIYLVFFYNFEILLLATAAAFTLHMLWGEFKLRSETVTTKSLVSIIGSGLMLWFTVAKTIVPGESWWLFPVLTLGVGFLISRFVFFDQKFSSTEQYLWFVTLLSYVMAYVFGAAGNVFGALIVLHVINFTLLGHAYAKKGGYMFRYWIETCVVFALTGLGYVFFIAGQAPLLALFFLPTSYYLWSHGHILSTVFLDVLKRFS